MFGFSAIERLILTLPLFLLAICFHEFMHAWAADKLGDSTPRSFGRLTLNPKSHLDPFGTAFFIIGALFGGILFGWAKPVPINPYNFRNPRRDMAFVSVSGPAANFMLAVVFYLLFMGLKMMFLYPPPAMIFVMSILRFGVVINIVLICFNLIPIPPLDGSRVLTWILPPRYAMQLDKMEPYGFIILLILLWTGILWIIYSPLFQLISRLFPGIGL